MSDAQVWTVIGGFLGMLVVLSGLVLALVRAEIAVLRERLDGIRNELVVRLDGLEQDLQRLYERVFAQDGGETPEP